MGQNEREERGMRGEREGGMKRKREWEGDRRKELSEERKGRKEREKGAGEEENYNEIERDREFEVCCVAGRNGKTKPRVQGFISNVKALLNREACNIINQNM